MSELRRFRGNSTLRPRSASSATTSPSPSAELPFFLPGIASTLRSLSALNRQERSMADRIGRTGAVLGHRNTRLKIALDPRLILIYNLDTIAPIKKLRYKNYGGEIYGISLIMYGLCQSLAYQICRVTYYYPEPLNSNPQASVRHGGKTHQSFVQSRLINRRQSNGEEGGGSAEGNIIILIVSRYRFDISNRFRSDGREFASGRDTPHY